MARVHGALLLLVLAISAVMLFPPTTVTAVTVMPGGSHAAAEATVVPTHVVAPSVTSASRTSLSSTATGQRVLDGLRAANAPMSKVFLPNFNAHPTFSGGIVSPLYGVSPAPMGLGDFGIQNVGGTNVGTISYTNSVEGGLTLNSITPNYLGAAGPDQFTVQLNTVLNNVDLVGNLSNEFWIQNVPVYYASTGTLAFEDNIWNFSSPSVAFNAASIYAHGPGGFIIPGEVYIGVGPAFHVPTPFTVDVYNNATVFNNRPTIWFNYSVHEGSGISFSGSYDFAEFNSTGSSVALTPAPQPTFQINGQAANPTGFLLNDAEIMLGGPGGGSTTNIFAINATMNLWTLPNASARYVPVPAAFDFGTDTGETSSGIAEWASGGATPTAHLDAGPSLLYPLWGVVGSSFGATRVTFHLTPANAFVFASAGTSFSNATAAWAPTQPGGTDTYALERGAYSFEALLSDYQPKTLSGIVTSTQTVKLVSDPSMGIYTPLWAQGNGELAAISSSGSGSVTSPYVLINAPAQPIDPLFGEFNDYVWPVFAGIQLFNTTDYVTITGMPSFSLTYSLPYEAAITGGLGLPQTNYLPYNLFGVSHVTIDGNSAISGWFYSSDSFGTEANVVFWNSSHNLVASNTFDTMSLALLLFGGTANTIWGNDFTTVNPVATNTGTIENYGFQWGLELYESGDLIYNNEFLTPITAYTPTVNVYNGAPLSSTDQWSISEQSASNVKVVNGWSLSGSILGLGYQGGNYWANYGMTSLPFGTPYGQLPYSDGGLISSGGDNVPLTPTPIYKVTFTETGLPATTLWSVTFGGLTLTSSTSSIVFWQLDGTYAYTVGTLVGFSASPSIGGVVLNGVNQSVAIVWT
jgi:thermopsin